MNIFSQFYSTKYNNESSQQLVVRNMKNSDNKSDVYHLLKNIELDINNKDVEIFVLQENKKNYILGVGCVLFKLTNTDRIGVIGVIHNIHTHKSVNIEDRNKFIEEMAYFAIDRGCYACTLKNSYLGCIRCETN